MNSDSYRDRLGAGADHAGGARLLPASESCQRAGLRTGQVATPAGEGSAARAVPAGPPQANPGGAS